MPITKFLPVSNFEKLAEEEGAEIKTRNGRKYFVSKSGVVTWENVLVLYDESEECLRNKFFKELSERTGISEKNLRFYESYGKESTLADLFPR